VTSRVRLEPLTETEFDAWGEHSRRGFAAQQVAAGLQPETEAREAAERGFAELLPAGLATPLHHVFRVVGPEGGTVGHLWVRVRPLSTEVEAYVYDVELLPEARGQGLGRATMLAAETVARDLGATVMRLNVFGHNTPALRLYESLGYTVASAAMSARVEELPDTVTAGPRVELRPMTDEEYAVFRPHLQDDYGANLAAADGLPEVEARRKAAADLDELLPWGLRTPGHLIWTASEGTHPVGHLWLQLQPRSDGLHAFGFDFAVREGLRRRGYGRAVAAAAGRACRERGVLSVGLSVFGSNTGARSLYEQLGFRLTAQTMTKRLS
jgi:ribosomal protein S18 acetylase RimI-like enzyme